MAARSRRSRAVRALAWVLLVIIALLVVLIAFATREAVADPIKREAEIRLAGLVGVPAPYRIALLSDIHIGNRTMPPERISRIVAQVNAARPDLVVIAGDFVNGADGALVSDPQALIGPLSALRARNGVIAVLGNHDHWTDPAAVSAALEAAGIQVLRNEITARGPVLIAGFDDHYSGHADIAATMRSAPQGSQAPLIAISHTPDIAPALPGEFQLVLAGHTHCGQMVMPLIGALAPVFGKLIGDRHYYNARYECGLVQEGARTTIVTAGLGSGSIPLRLGAAPDWWLVTVRGE